MTVCGSHRRQPELRLASTRLRERARLACGSGADACHRWRQRRGHAPAAEPHRPALCISAGGGTSVRVRPLAARIRRVLGARSVRRHARAVEAAAQTSRPASRPARRAGERRRRGRAQLRGAARLPARAGGDRAKLGLQRQTVEVTKNQQATGWRRSSTLPRRPQASATEAELPAIEHSQWQAIHRIAVLLRTGAERDGAGAVPPRPIPLPPQEVPVGVPSELLRRRPESPGRARDVGGDGAGRRRGRRPFHRFTLDGTFGLQSSETGDCLTTPAATSRSARPSACDFPTPAAVARRGAAPGAAGGGAGRYDQSVLRALAETEARGGSRCRPSSAACLPRDSARSYQDPPTWRATLRAGV